VLFWAVVSDSLQEAVGLVTSREEAEAIVQAWDRDEPEQAGELRVEEGRVRDVAELMSPPPPFRKRFPGGLPATSGATTRGGR
jgi:hypothetical protein